MTRQASRFGGKRLACVLACVSALTSIAIASASSIAYLGKPTNAISPISAFPLGYFHHIKGTLPPKRTLVVLGGGGMDSWAVVKALDQFGKLAHLKGLDGPCSIAVAGPAKGYQVCAPPSYDWSHATYRSRYIAFDHRDLLTTTGKLFQKPTKAEKTLLAKYSELPGCGRPHASQSLCIRDAKLPFMAVGDYAQIATTFLTIADFGKPIPAPTVTGVYGSQTTGMTFEEIRSALATGKEPSSVSYLIKDVNGEANIITALICHADGKRPASVCGRKAIKRILKHAK